MNAPKDRKPGWGMSGAIGAAVAASACCTIPFLLVSAGVGGAWVSALTVFEPVRPFFIAIAVGLLAFAAYRIYQQSCRIDCDCVEEAVSLRTRQMLLVGAAVVTLGLIASPQFIPKPPVGNVPATEGGEPAATLQEITLQIEGMTCTGCATTVATALNRLDGVADVTVTYTPPQAVVQFDESIVSIDELTSATTNAGYPSAQIIERSGP